MSLFILVLPIRENWFLEYISMFDLSLGQLVIIDDEVYMSLNFGLRYNRVKTSAVIESM